MFRLDRYAVENYVTPAALRAVLGAQIPADEPRRKRKDQIGMNVKCDNRRIAQAMTAADVGNTGQ